ncbi:MAG: nucleotidyl transferase AbiEii/AbiGii toxin family protein [Spirochaetaceae bacterium]
MQGARNHEALHGKHGMSAMGKDHSASVLARLLNHSRSHKEDYQSLLIRYVGERFLYRLGRSSYRDEYVLKGAYLLSMTLQDQTYRSTKDIDFLKTGDAGAEFILESLKDICSTSYPEDAVEFDLDSISIQDTREHNAYQGRRATIQTHIGKAKVVLQIDIGIGDAIHPRPVGTTIPSLLEMDRSKIESYPIETVIAEKLEAIVALSLLTSRMKDFYDLYIISKNFTLGYEDVSEAVRKTFARRKTALPTETPVVFTEQFTQDAVKRTQWRAFARKLRNAHSSLKLAEVVDQISEFAHALWDPGSDHPHVWGEKSGWQ